MPVPYKKNKIHIYNWNAKNPERKKLADEKTNKRGENQKQ